MIHSVSYYCIMSAFFMEIALSSECDYTGAVLVDGMCAIYDNNRTDWYTAKKKCQNYGMYLATVQSTEQMELILQDRPIGTTIDCWTGGNDISTDGRYVWDEDKRPIVTDFLNRKDNDNKRNDKYCVYINNEYRLHIAPCSDLKAALCLYRLPTPVYYFGKSNQYMCHCMEGPCDYEGYCYRSAGLCSPGWFGDACQFRNLASNIYGPLGVLTDDDDSTCLTIESPLIIKLKAGSFFTKITLTTDVSYHLHGISLDFIVNGARVSCQNRMEKRYMNSVDISCQGGPFVVDDVIINWESKRKMCSVYINGEENYAINQYVTVPDIVDSKISLPVDGRKSPYDECFQGNPKVSLHTWTLTFTSPRYIHEIIIYRKPKSEGYAHMNGFYVKGYDENGLLLFRYDDTGQHVNESIVWILTMVGDSMKQIVIGVDNVNDRRHLELCEVEAFGDCVVSLNGMYCRHLCNRYTCPTGFCIDGVCQNCSYGIDLNGRCFTDIFNVKEDNGVNWKATLKITSIFVLSILVIILNFYLIAVQTKFEEITSNIDKDECPLEKTRCEDGIQQGDEELDTSQVYYTSHSASPR